MFTFTNLLKFLVSVVVLLVVLWVVRIVLAQVGLGSPFDVLILLIIVVAWVAGLWKFLQGGGGSGP